MRRVLRRSASPPFTSASRPSARARRKITSAWAAIALSGVARSWEIMATRSSFIRCDASARLRWRCSSASEDRSSTTLARSALSVWR
jgi:hypothetical protein